MPFEIINPATHIDFIGKRRLAGMLSAGVILASLVAIPLQGIRLGIDFAGGTEIQLRFDSGVVVDEGRIRAVVNQLPGVDKPSVVRFGDEHASEFLIRFQSKEAVPVAESEAEAPPEQQDIIALVARALAEDIGSHDVRRVGFVGPRVGAELRTKGLLALLWASLAILIYVAFRFSSRFAPGAIVAVVHDLLITSGVFVMLGMEFDLQVLAAMLAILGYSLNDTIIIYDRIRENMELRTRHDLPEVLNESVNQTLSRTVLTSGTTLLALLALFFLGGEVIRPFAFAMLIGVVVGTYSSIYVAAPVLLFLERRFGHAKA